MLTLLLRDRDSGVGMVTLVPHNLYDVRIPDSEGNILLMEIVRNEYHTLTTQCLHTSKRARSDLQTSILFHCTRVQRSNTDDQKKLARTFRHIIGLGGSPLVPVFRVLLLQHIIFQPPLLLLRVLLLQHPFWGCWWLVSCPYLGGLQVWLRVYHLFVVVACGMIMGLRVGIPLEGVIKRICGSLLDS